MLTNYHVEDLGKRCDPLGQSHLLSNNILWKVKQSFSFPKRNIAAA